ncbi:MAG: hypothetical protein A2381_12645 [Bdellovibrionales bacterium RIFOXYB1_FULL_37_110]|nr:MAG: hypothetical protein A2417_12330 [Bdellovibrionales bacterium RIFOXYC1_FULL_37_79]OFZ60363.1 MAG: hypothetical protein A2381_12645 [Bdellovibrionales bacterium RIFOXYB1_FULL_37_110]OFZ63853.1 MAG: hypothetical protein A2577_05560 [Bdellovibrionales bacterium RIFOXYD1_FULL_36_51]
MVWILMINLFFGCMENQTSGQRRTSGVTKGLQGMIDPIKDTNPLIPVITPTAIPSSVAPEVLLNGIVDPTDGSYKTKISLPKNYNGWLYLSGLNLFTLKDKIVYVRFRFGTELSSVTMQGLIAKGSGITPDTQIDHLILDFSKQDFQSMRVHYDLYDYKDYDESDILVGNSQDKNLYCRGLKTEDDVTFVPTASHPQCNYAGARCLYSYASIIDSGLYDGSNLTTLRKYPAYDVEGNGYHNNSLEVVKNRCLPDSAYIGDVQTTLGPLGTIVTNNSIGSVFRLDGKNYTWKGPYRTSALGLWQIAGQAVFGKYGVFQKSIDGSVNPEFGYQANLYPRAQTISLQSQMEYMGSAAAFARKEKKIMLASGESMYMDGCSTRVIRPSVNKCNVTADLEVYYLDENEKEVSVLKNKFLKIQLIEEQNVYLTSRSCQIDSNCGSGECCFNHQCFEKSMVGGTCLSEMPSEGNRQTGENCQNDLECSSLCCSNQKRCAVHIYSQDEKVLCGKSAGESCIAKEFCQEYQIPTCYKVKTGIFDGKQTCAIRCYYKPTFGDCVNFRCQIPATPSVPYLDLKNPNCTDAIDAPTQF